MLGDETQISQVLVDVIVNAFHAMRLTVDSVILQQRCDGRRKGNRER